MHVTARKDAIVDLEPALTCKYAQTTKQTTEYMSFTHKLTLKGFLSLCEVLIGLEVIETRVVRATNTNKAEVQEVYSQTQT